MAWSMNRFPSEVSPWMATNTHPGLTRRESYSTPLTLGSPLWARTSAPSSRCWKVIAGNYRPGEIGRCHCIRSLHPHADYQGHFSRLAEARYITVMSTGTGPAKYHCAQCDQPESSCDCEKFCC